MKLTKSLQNFVKNVWKNELTKSLQNFVNLLLKNFVKCLSEVRKKLNFCEFCFDILLTMKFVRLLSTLKTLSSKLNDIYYK